MQNLIRDIKACVHNDDENGLEQLLGPVLFQQQRIQALSSNVATGLVLYQQDTGEIVDINRRAAELFQQEDQALVGKPVQQFLAAGQNGDFRLDLLCPNGDQSLRLNDITLKRPSGETIQIDYQAIALACPLRGPMVQAIIMRASDCAEEVADAHDRAEHLRELNQQLQEAEQMRMEFLAMISHELRTPLNAVIGYNSLLEEGIYGDLNEKQHKAVQRVDRNATRLLTLINQLLELSRLEAGLASVFHENVNLPRLINQLLDDYQNIADENQLDLRVSHPHRELFVYTDGSKLQEIIRQLLSNSLKFTQQGEVSITIRHDENNARIEIRDTGPGIPQEKRDSIFEIFRQGTAPAAASRRPEGVGAGLAIVRRLADLLEIAVEVESQPGQGSTFTLMVPISQEEAKPASTAQPEPPEPEAEAPAEAGQDAVASSEETGEPAPSVLVVDDDPYMVEIITEFLENNAGYRVLKAHSGMHAMLQLAQSRPDYLLVDLLMPNVHGERVVEYCRQLWGENVKIIIITGKSLSPSERERLESRVHSILLKGDAQHGTVIKKLESVLPVPAAI